VSEPHARADTITEVLPGLWHWSLHDERIDFVGDSYALAADEGAVLVDAHRLPDGALGRLGAVAAICLTAGSHERSAWRLRSELGAPVYAPKQVREVEEEPDVRYGDGDVLPGGLAASFTPGAGTTQHTLVRAGKPAIAFCPDLLLREPSGTVALVPDEHLYDPDEARRSVAKLFELPFDVLCLTHGGPVLDDPKAAIARVVDAMQR
jgi:hypothetical protein